MAETKKEQVQLKQEKAELRKSLKKKLRTVGEEDLAQQSVAIWRYLREAPFYKESSSVAVYLTAPKLREVDTMCIVSDLLQEGSMACCPCLLLESRRK